MPERRRKEDNARIRSAQTKLARTREALLAAAAEVFREKGWVGARMEDIAREAGVSAATAYNHFQTKHALIGQVYGPLIRPSLEQARQQLSDGAAPSGVLESHIRELAETMRRHQALTLPFIDAVQDYTVKFGTPPDPDDPNDPRNAAPLPAAITTAISVGQASGLFRTYPPATDLGTYVINLMLLRSVTRRNEGADATAEFILTLMFGVLTPDVLLAAGIDGRPFRTSA